MSEQTDINYIDGEVVWVKLGSCWWPGEVVAPEKLPPDLLPSLRKQPIAVVKFFQEDSYEYVNSNNSIYKYNCSRKEEFINKGLHMYRTKHGQMDKFPEDVIRAETAIGGDITILTRDEFQESKKESYAGIFGDKDKKSPLSAKKGKGKTLPATPKLTTPIRKTKQKSNYKVHILVQKSGSTPIKTTDSDSTPSTSRADSDHSEEKSKDTPVTDKPVTVMSTPLSSGSGIYSCHSCPFTTTRMNVMIIHNKTHSNTFIPHTPTPIKKRIIAKSSPKPITKTYKPQKSLKQNKTPQISKEKLDSVPNEKKVKRHRKRLSLGQENDGEHKKFKADHEIKNSLLADWDDGDEDSVDDSSAAAARGSPAEPIPAEFPEPTNPVPKLPSPIAIDPVINEKPESSSDSKYDFCEDEYWPEEADAGRKIPRVKNPSKRKNNTKSTDEELAKEVAELLNKTTVPELPLAPEPLTIEENFPKASVEKSPDKAETPLLKTDDIPTTKKPIFKTKTFFRSRHSRSQDVIGKYVAEQLNAAERMNIDLDINGSDVASSPEDTVSPPIETTKVAKLAPKIQLKKMKAEALKEFNHKDYTKDVLTITEMTDKISKEKSNASHCSEEPKNNKEEYKMIGNLKPNQEDKIEQAVDVVPKENLNVKILQKQDVELQANKELEPKNLNLDTSMNETTASAVDALLSVSREVDSVPEIVSNDPPEDLFEDDIKEENNLNGSKECQKANETIDYKNNEKPVIVIESDIIDPEAKNVVTIINKEESEVINSINVTGNDLTFIEEVTPKIDKNNYSIDSFNKDPTSINKYQSAITNSINVMGNDNKFIEEVTPKIDTDNYSIESCNKDLTTINKDQTAIINSINVTGNDITFIEDVTRNNDKNNYSIESCIKDQSLIRNSGNDNAFIEEVTRNINENNYSIESCNKDLNKNLLIHDNEILLTKSDNTITPYPPEPLIMKVNDITEKSLLSKEINSDLTPSECDLQIAETLLNLPSTAIQVKSPVNKEANMLYHQNVTLPELVVNCENVIYETNQSVLSKSKEVSPNTEKQSTNNNDSINLRFETEEEKSENFFAAQSLVQMSESIDHTVTISDVSQEKNTVVLPALDVKAKETPVIDNVEKQTTLVCKEKQPTVTTEVVTVKSMHSIDPVESNVLGLQTEKHPEPFLNSSKLLKILEEPLVTKAIEKPIRKLITTGKEKILNFDVAKSSEIKQAPKQKIIIRRTMPSKSLIHTNKKIINNLNESTASLDNAVLSRNHTTTQDGFSVHTYTLQQPAEGSSLSPELAVQPKIRKITKPPPRIQKIIHPTLLSSPVSHASITSTTSNEDIFDINSMPMVLSDEILTPENIDKMPIVMADGNIITSTMSTPKIISHSPRTPNIIKPKHKPVVETERIITAPKKPEVKTLIISPVSEPKVSSTNIMSKASKLRGSKPMLVIDKTTGSHKIIVPKVEPAMQQLKPLSPAKVQSGPRTGKTEKLIILPTSQTGSPKLNRTQKIVIDPQTGKAHVLISKEPEGMNSAENKAVSAKLISQSRASSPGNTVMIITNAQGAQSRIVLTPEHEKILFPNKQQMSANTAPQVRTHKIIANSFIPMKSSTNIVSMPKAPTRIIAKQQKSAIITSKGQLIVGGQVATSIQSVAPSMETRVVKKPVQKAEPMIFLQEKSGAVLQLTTAQFEQLQRTGQLVQKSSATNDNKVIIQKAMAIPRPRNATPARRQKVEAISAIRGQPMPSLAPLTPSVASHSAPVPSPLALSHKTTIHATTAVVSDPVPAIVSTHNTVAPLALPVPTSVPQLSTSAVPSTSSAEAVKAPPLVPELNNFEELIPSTSIERQAEPPTDTAAAPSLADGSLLAVPGEHFGGPPGTFYLCVEDNGSLTPIDNRPLVLENDQLVPMEPARDILEAALASSDVFEEAPPDFRELNASVSGQCRVSETSATLQPIMSPAEAPRRVPPCPPPPLRPPASVPTSLELPITVTDPRLAAADKSMPLLCDEPSGPLLASPSLPRLLLPPS